MFEEIKYKVGKYWKNLLKMISSEVEVPESSMVTSNQSSVLPSIETTGTSSEDWD
jgi:hypothetical protein